jgi:aminoacyl tRNA synthase complex-interacting multifunctional protein 1
MIDIGNGEVRKIASGLKGRVDINDLKDSYVIVICNLKERVLCGWPSHGMLLCASDTSGNIEPIRPPEGSQAGDLVYIGDYPRDPLSVLTGKTTAWDETYKDFLTNDNKEATYKGTNLWKTDKGVITAKNLTNAKIS